MMLSVASIVLHMISTSILVSNFLLKELILRVASKASGIPLTAISSTYATLAIGLLIFGPIDVKL